MAARVEKKVVFAVRAQEMEGRAEKKGDRLSDNGRDVGVEENSEEENDCRETTADQRVDAEAEEDRGGEEEEESESAHDHDLERAGHASWVVGAAVFLVYYRSMYQTVPGGDSGELIVAGCTAGIAHPPGSLLSRVSRYPTYTMLAILFYNIIPFGSPAWRVNLVSVVLSTACAILHFRAVFLWERTLSERGSNPSTLPSAPAVEGAASGTAGTSASSLKKGGDGKARGAEAEGAGAEAKACCGEVEGVGGWWPWQWGVGEWSAAVAAWSLSFCPLIWQYSIQAEVFSLNNLMVAILLLLTVQFYRRRHVRTAYYGALSIGIGLTNQHTLVFYAAPLAVAILARGWRQLALHPRRLLNLVLLGLLGLTPYLYLPLAGVKAAFGAWGELDTLSGFATHFLRREYGTFRLYSGNDGSTEKQLGRALTLYLEHLHGEGMSPAGLAPLLVALGFARCLLDCAARRSANTVGVAFAGAYVTYMVVFHMLANLPLDQPLYLGVHVRFWMQAHLIAYGWLGLGAAAVLRLAVTLVSAARLSIRKVYTKASVEQGVGSRVAARLVCGSASCAVIVLQLSRQLDMMDQSGNWFVHNYGMMHLAPLPPESVLLVKGDVITNSIRYLQRCEGYRPDVQHLDQSMMTYKWFVRKQARHFRGIVFPNEVYNPYTDDGYAMETFLDRNALNASRPVYLCGGERLAWENGE